MPAPRQSSSPRIGPSPFAQCTAAAAQALRHSRRPGGFQVHKRVDHRVGPVEVSLQPPGPSPHPAGTGRCACSWTCAAPPPLRSAAGGLARRAGCPCGARPAWREPSLLCRCGGCHTGQMSLRAANNLPRNATVASAAELALSGPGGASKNPRLRWRWRRGLPGGQLEQPTQTRDVSPQPPQLATATGRPRSTRSRISLTLTTVRARNPRRWLPDSSRRAYFRSCRTHVRWSALCSGYPKQIRSR